MFSFNVYDNGLRTGFANCNIGKLVLSYLTMSTEKENEFEILIKFPKKSRFWSWVYGNRLNCPSCFFR